MRACWLLVSLVVSSSAWGQLANKSYATALKKGRAAVGVGKNADAILAFRAALVAVPDDATALSELGAAALAAGDVALAEQSTRAAVAHAAGNDKLKGASLYNLGRICERKNDRAGAVDAYTQSLRARPNGTVWRALASLDAAAAKPFDPLAPRPMTGPTPTLEETIQQLIESFVEDANVMPVDKPPPPFLEVRAVRSSHGGFYTSEKGALSLAVRLASGWFVCADVVQTESDDNSDEDGQFAMVDITLPAKAGLPIAARYVEMQRANKSSSNIGWLTLIGVGPSGKPSCTSFVVDAVPSGEWLDGANRERAKQPVDYTLVDGTLTIKGVPKGIPARLRDGLMGQHVLVFP